MKKRKRIIIPILLLLIALLAFGYAYLTTTLTISGITDIDSNNWDVYFDNVVVTNGSVSGAQEIEAPTITSDTEVEFHVNLKKPGDFYEFTIEARNDGTIDAMIETVEKKLNGVVVTTLPAYLNYIVTYEDDLEIAENHLLAAESLETYKIRVDYRTDINPSDLPSGETSLDLSFGVGFVQSDSNAVPARTFIYTTYDIITVGNEVPSGATVYDNYEDAVAAFEHPFFLRHTVVNNIVVATYAGVINNGNVYYVRGLGATQKEGTPYWNNDSPYYESNKAIMLDAFGESACHEVVDHNDETYKEYACTHSGDYYLNLVVSVQGNVFIDGGSHGLSIHPSGVSNCGET